MRGLTNGKERRRKSTFEMQRELCYKVAENDVVVAAGSGRTINMSSCRIAFAADQELTSGAFVELSISWPALLDETLPMRLIVFGRVLRCTGTTAACTIDKYEFRTQARTFQAASGSTRSDGMLERWAVGMRKETWKTRAAGA